MSCSHWCNTKKLRYRKCSPEYWSDFWCSNLPQQAVRALGLLYHSLRSCRGTGLRDIASRVRSLSVENTLGLSTILQTPSNIKGGGHLKIFECADMISRILSKEGERMHGEYRCDGQISQSFMSHKAAQASLLWQANDPEASEGRAIADYLCRSNRSSGTHKSLFRPIFWSLLSI